MRFVRIIALVAFTLLASGAGAYAGFFGSGSSSVNGAVVASGRTLYYDDCSSATLPAGAAFSGNATPGTWSYDSAANARKFGVTHQVYNNLPAVVLKSTLVWEFDFKSPALATDPLLLQVFDGSGGVVALSFASSNQIILNTLGVTRFSSGVWAANVTYHVLLKIDNLKHIFASVQSETGAYISQYSYTETTNRIAQGLTLNSYITDTDNGDSATGVGLWLYHCAIYDGQVVATGGGSVSPPFSGGNLSTGLAWANGGSYTQSNPEIAGTNDSPLYIFAGPVASPWAGTIAQRTGINVTANGSFTTIAQFTGGTVGMQRSARCYWHATANNGTEVQVADGCELFQYVRNFGGGTIQVQATNVSQTSLTTSGTLAVTFQVVAGAAPNNIQAALSSSLGAATGSISAYWIDAGGSGGGAFDLAAAAK